MYNEQLTAAYRQLDKDMADLHYLLTSAKQYEATQFLPTDENIASVRIRQEELVKRADALETPDAVYAVEKMHLVDFADSLGFAINDAAANPQKILQMLVKFYEKKSRQSKIPQEERVKLVEKRFRSVLDNFDIITDLIFTRNSPEKYSSIQGNLAFTLECFKDEYKNVEVWYEGFKPAFIARIKALIQETIANYEAFLPELGAKAQGASGAYDNIDVCVQLPEGKYKETLARLYGVNLDDMESWYEEEIEVTRQEVFDIAAKLPIGNDPVPTTMEEVNDLLFKYSAPCDKPLDMYKKADIYMARSRKVAHEMIRLPEDEWCATYRLPYSQKDTFPWGGYQGGDFTGPQYHGNMILNQYNYFNITDAWIKMNTMHEAYPGHHCQFVRAAWDTIPETMKIGSKNVPLLEGTCLRTERAFEDTFEEDPFYKLHVAYRRHHTAVRILVDFTLFYFPGTTIRDACDIYKKEMGFDFVTARGQVRSHQATPGYFTTYHYGMKKLTEWEKEYGYNKKDYTELLFSAGLVGIRTFKAYLDLTDEERERYYHEFKSLDMA